MPKRSSKRGSGWIDFAAVKRAVTIEQVLEHYGVLTDLQEKKDGLKGACPMFEHTTAAPFHVSTSKGVWFCHACDKGGNVIDLVQAMEECEPKSAALKLAEWFGIEATKPSSTTGRRRQRRREAARVSQPANSAESEALDAPQSDDLDQGQGVTLPDSDDSTESSSGNAPLSFSLKGLDSEHEALGSLGFQSETVRFFEAGLCSRGLMAGRLAVPIHSPTGELLAYAGRSLEGDVSYKYPDQFGRELELYNLHRAVGSDEHLASGLILVADVLDVWRLSEAGYPNAIASMATSLSEKQTSLLATYAAPSEKVLLLLPASPERDELVARLSSAVFVRALDVAGELPLQELHQLLAA